MYITQHVLDVIAWSLARLTLSNYIAPRPARLRLKRKRFIIPSFHRY